MSIYDKSIPPNFTIVQLYLYHHILNRSSQLYKLQNIFHSSPFNYQKLNLVYLRIFKKIHDELTHTYFILQKDTKDLLIQKTLRKLLLHLVKITSSIKNR